MSKDKVIDLNGKAVPEGEEGGEDLVLLAMETLAEIAGNPFARDANRIDAAALLLDYLG